MDGIILKLITHSLQKRIEPITVKVSTLQPIGGGWSHITQVGIEPTTIALLECHPSNVSVNIFTELGERTENTVHIH